MQISLPDSHAQHPTRPLHKMQLGTIRFGSATKVPPKRTLKYYRISLCQAKSSRRRYARPWAIRCRGTIKVLARRMLKYCRISWCLGQCCDALEAMHELWKRFALVGSDSGTVA